VEKTLQQMSIFEISEVLIEMARDLRDISHELEEREQLPVPDEERSPSEKGRSAHG